MKKAREAKQAAEAAARRERGEPEPEAAKSNEEEQKGKGPGIEINTWDDNLQIANEAKSKGCSVEEIDEKVIDTRQDKESESDEEELPPSLEQVTTEEL